jgi:hypothetical protein
MKQVSLSVQELDNNLSAYNKEDISNMLSVVYGAISGYNAYIDADTNKTKFDSRFAVELSNGAEFQATCTDVHPETGEMIYPLALFEIVQEIASDENDLQESTENEADTEGDQEIDPSLALLFRLKFVSKKGDIISVLDSCKEFADMLKKLVKIREKREGGMVRSNRGMGNNLKI